jgi:hypothetical protein
VKWWYYGVELTSTLTEPTRFFCFADSWDEGLSGPLSVIFLTVFPIADPILGISFSIFWAALFNPRPKSSTVMPLLFSVLRLSAEVDASAAAAAACVSPTTNRAAMMMTILCMRHLSISEIVPCAVRHRMRGGLFDRRGPVWGPPRLVMITLCSGSVQNEWGIRHSATEPTSTSA